MVGNFDLELISAWLGSRPALVPAAVFAITFSESLALIGLFVPGVVLMSVVGVLVAMGSAELIPVLVWAVVGAFAGDGVSYLLGRRLQGRADEIWPFSRHVNWLRRGESFFIRYGVFSVVLGRFVGPVRPIVPLIAGVMGMRPGLFYVTNGLSAVVWAPLYLLPGYLLGSSFTGAPVLSAKVLGGSFVLIIFGWLVWRWRFGSHRFWDTE